MEIKKGTSYVVPVRLVVLSTGAGVAGVTAPIVYVAKHGGTSTQKSITNGVNWTEVDSGHFPGVYRLTLSAADLDTTGPVLVSAIGGASDVAVLLYDVVEQQEHDTFTLLQTVDTLLQSVDADIAGVDTKVSATSTTTAAIDTKVSAVDTKVSAVDTKVTTVDTKVDTVDQRVQSAQALLNLLRKYLRNRSKTDATAKTFTIFDDDGTTAILTFTLKDGSGAGSVTDIKEMTPQGSWVAP